MLEEAVHTQKSVHIYVCVLQSRTAYVTPRHVITSLRLLCVCRCLCLCVCPVVCSYGSVPARLCVHVRVSAPDRLQCRNQPASQLCIITDHARHLCLQAIETACRTATQQRHYCLRKLCLCASITFRVVLYSSGYMLLQTSPTVYVCVCAGRPTVYMGHSLRSHNPMFGPTYSLGFHSFCLAKLMATSIMTSPHHSVIGLQTSGLSANNRWHW